MGGIIVFYRCAYRSKKVIKKVCFFAIVGNQTTIYNKMWYSRDLFIVEETISYCPISFGNIIRIFKIGGHFKDIVSFSFKNFLSTFC